MLADTVARLRRGPAGAWSVRPHRQSIVGVLGVVAAAYVAAGGFVHLQTWRDTYRDLPSSVPGVELVQLGFPANAAASAVLAVALVLTSVRGGARLAALVGVAAIAVQATSLTLLVATRRGTVLGWSEPVWDAAARSTRAVELAGLAAVGIWLIVRTRAGRL